jgi:hypothetical protein
VTHWHFYLLGTAHRSGPWVEYLRWLQQQARLFLRSAYIEDLIANLLDSDDNNEVIDEYDNHTARHHTTGAWAVPKLHGMYYSIFPLSSYLEIEVLNND